MIKLTCSCGAALEISESRNRNFAESDYDYNRRMKWQDEQIREFRKEHSCTIYNVEGPKQTVSVACSSCGKIARLACKEDEDNISFADIEQITGWTAPPLLCEVCSAGR